MLILEFPNSTLFRGTLWYRIINETEIVVNHCRIYLFPIRLLGGTCDQCQKALHKGINSWYTCLLYWGNCDSTIHIWWFHGESLPVSLPIPLFQEIASDPIPRFPTSQYHNQQPTSWLWPVTSCDSYGYGILVADEWQLNSDSCIFLKMVYNTRTCCAVWHPR